MRKETLHFARGEPWSEHSLRLVFDKRLPAFLDGPPSRKTLEPWDKRVQTYYRSEGQLLAAPLLEHLPRGLVDGLLVALLQERCATSWLSFPRRHTGCGLRLAQGANE